jgi:multiple sugar transport system ATP-binding protein
MITKTVTADNGNNNIILTGLTKRFGEDAAVRGLNLTIHQGELLVLLGPSGCGKTTTLNLLAGLEEPDSGDIYFGPQRMNSVLPEDRDISMVFQSFGLYPHLNARDNISFALRLRKVPKAEIALRIAEITRLLNIERLLDRRIHQLSGGERQRVAIAKALVKRPRLFLLDEPFSSLDADMRRQFRSELVRIHRNLQTTMVFVTHDQEEAMSIADRIILMRGGELIQVGSPLEVYYQPATLWGSQFVGTHPINIIPCQLNPTDYQALLFETDRVNTRLEKGLVERIRARTSAQEILFGVRPEFISLEQASDGASGILAKIFSKEVLGSDTLYDVMIGPHHLRVVQPSVRQFYEDETVSLRFIWGKVFVFDKDTEKCLVDIEYLESSRDD